jgi:hypothetical protein
MKSKLLTCLISILLLGVAFLFFACGGGSGGGTFTAGGGIGGSGVTIGAASQFGSIFVNEIEFETTAATVVVDGGDRGAGDQAVRNNIAIGKIVRIEGPFDENGAGTANRVVYNEDIIGPVESITAIDASARRLVVMGQTVVIDTQTNFEGTTLSTIAVGNLLEVSGFASDTGAIEATYLRKIADSYVPGTEVQIRGFASEVNAALKTFRINSLTVNYAAADASQLNAGNPIAGQHVEVKGALTGSILNATIVRPEDILGVSDADNVQIAGIVTAFTSLESFALNGVAVRTDVATEYKGILPEDIGLGSRLMIRGALTNRVLLADAVKSSTQAVLEGNVASTAAATITLSGFGMSIVVDTNGLTRFLGAADSVSEIDVGDHLKVFGKSFASGSLTADKIIVSRNPNNRAWLRGPVDAVAGDRISILGFEVLATDLPQNGFSLENGGALTVAQFMTQISVGDMVHLKGRYNPNDISWETASLGKAE